MNRFKTALLIGAALLLFFIAIGTFINMIFIAMRPETISVVNTIIGQTVMIVCLLALGRILFKKGLAQRDSGEQGQISADSNQDSQSKGG